MRKYCEDFEVEECSVDEFQDLVAAQRSAFDSMVGELVNTLDFLLDSGKLKIRNGFIVADELELDKDER